VGLPVSAPPALSGGIHSSKAFASSGFERVVFGLTRGLTLSIIASMSPLEGYLASSALASALTTLGTLGVRLGSIRLPRKVRAASRASV
jgi:hypothetical protein